MANLDSNSEGGGGAPAGGDPGVGIGGPPGGVSPLSGAPPVVEPAKGGDPAPKDPAKGAAAPAKEPVKSAADPAVAPPAPAAGDVPPAAKEWPKEWRELFAGDDKKRIAKVARYSDPGKVLDALVAVETDLHSGRYIKKLPTHYTDEELSEFRKANNIPDKPDGYDTDLGNGIVWGEADKPHIDDFTRYAHENNMTPDEVKRGLGWWAQYQETLLAKQDEADTIAMQEAATTLRAKWGGEETKNKNFLKTVLDQQEGLYSGMLNARMPNGRRLGDSPEALDFLVKKFAEADPYARELPGNGQDPAKTVEKEMADIKAMMGNKESKYWKGPESAAIQERYRNLIELRSRAAAVNAR